jgi:hypothetical protein
VPDAPNLAKRRSTALRLSLRGRSHTPHSMYYVYILASHAYVLTSPCRLGGSSVLKMIGVSMTACLSRKIFLMRLLNYWRRTQTTSGAKIRWHGGTCEFFSYVLSRLNMTMLRLGRCSRQSNLGPAQTRLQ